MNYKLAIFDLDGTILDTLEDLADAVNYGLRSMGYPERSIDEVRRFVGNGIALLMKRAVPEGTSDEDCEKALGYFKEFYALHCEDKTGPYPGINDLLKELRAAGCKTAVVSNKIDSAVQTLINNQFPGCFDYALGEIPECRRKPAPDMCEKVLRELDIHKEDSVYIGDSDVDLETAANSGLPCIGVEWGFRGREFLKEHGAELIAATPEDIKKWVLG